MLYMEMRGGGGAKNSSPTHCAYFAARHFEKEILAIIYRLYTCHKHIHHPDLQYSPLLTSLPISSPLLAVAFPGCAHLFTNGYLKWSF